MDKLKKTPLSLREAGFAISLAWIRATRSSPEEEAAAQARDPVLKNLAFVGRGDSLMRMIWQRTDDVNCRKISYLCYQLARLLQQITSSQAYKNWSNLMSPAG